MNRIDLVTMKRSIVNDPPCLCDCCEINTSIISIKFLEYNYSNNLQAELVKNYRFNLCDVCFNLAKMVDKELCYYAMSGAEKQLKTMIDMVGNQGERNTIEKKK